MACLGGLSSPVQPPSGFWYHLTLCLTCLFESNGKRLEQVTPNLISPPNSPISCILRPNHPWYALLDGVPLPTVADTPCTHFVACNTKGCATSKVGKPTTNLTTDCGVSISCVTSPFSKRSKQFVITAWTLHIACTVLPKCRPWWTNGSLVELGYH